jgi:hypothetical protein
MAKAYIQHRPELADAAAVETYCAANPAQFTIGTIVVAANGAACIVIDAAGTTALISVEEPTP